ncbi:MAG: DUF4147 domain-containing protein [Pseudomonadota bacterium]
MTNDPRQLVTHLWHTGVAAVDGYAATTAALADLPERPDQVIAVGKAAAAMARAADDRWRDVPMLIVTKDHHGDGAPPHAMLLETAHPVPDERSLHAGRTLRRVVGDLGQNARLLILVSGGASSLAEDLVPGAGLADMVAMNQRLLAEGLDIGAMNAERRKLSRIKGGGLLAGFRGDEAVTLAISDVPGDALGVIGSGIGATPEDPAFKHVTQIIASNAHARAAAAAEAQSLSLEVIGSTECMHADVNAVASDLGARARVMAPGVLIAGGEPTVVLPPSPGRGGRNQALALAMAREIAGRSDLTVLVAGTDGSDGPTDAAGGLVTGKTWASGAEAALTAADSGTFLSDHDALFVTGPTGTNVMDLAIILRA